VLRRHAARRPRESLSTRADHAIASLELGAALARAASAGATGVATTAAAEHASAVAALAETLRDHPAQQQAFLRTWR
jgi:hypothetical protein